MSNCAQYTINCIWGRVVLQYFSNDAGFWWDHVKYTPHLWRYMLPLFVVYVAEYVINQSLFELMFSKDTQIEGFCLTQPVQYRL